MLMWRIYYGDGSTYDNLSGPVQKAPARGVQAIAMRDERVGRLVWHSKDFYWYDGETWVGGDVFGLWDYLVRPGWKKVVFGRTLARPDFDALLAKAMDDPDFPPKDGWRQVERRVM
jgi:hypothetical protein